jgi:hypothetical protein
MARLSAADRKIVTTGGVFFSSLIKAGACINDVAAAIAALCVDNEEFSTIISRTINTGLEGGACSFARSQSSLAARLQSCLARSLASLAVDPRSQSILARSRSSLAVKPRSLSSLAGPTVRPSHERVACPGGGRGIGSERVCGLPDFHFLDVVLI